VARFPSPEWLAAYREAINSSEEFRVAGAEWEGDVSYGIEAEPTKHVMSDAWGWFDLHHGECRDAKPVTQDEGERATFVIRAPYSTWKDVIVGRLDPIKGMTQGRLRLSGDLHAIRDNVAAVGCLVSLAKSIPTEFPDE
jgi:putative sterol carrier protein